VMSYSNEITVHLITGRNQKARGPLHVAFANMRDEPEEVKAFSKRWAVRPVDSDPLEPLLIPIRDTIRIAWRSESRIDAISKGPALLYPELALRISKRKLASIESTFTARIRVTAGRTEVVPDHWWQTAWLLYLRDCLLGKTAICENPACPTPFFIRKRKTQKFCDGGHDCSAYGDRLRAIKWWRARGNAWRSEQRKSGKGKK
jgi:hypothetical protein